jgi:hypothetical protein
MSGITTSGFMLHGARLNATGFAKKIDSSSRMSGTIFSRRASRICLFVMLWSI